MPKAAAPSQKYHLSIDPRVLDHLGIKLYSNAAAVLSEAVANAWDADAKTVTVTIKSDVITIEDNGIGMGLSAINDRFLAVGYDKRKAEGETSKAGRPFMGRKGIGKLALFSIADEIDIHTRTKTENHAFNMKTDAIRKAVAARRTYYPTPVTFDGPTRGTRIVLRKLKKKRTGASVPALRKRIARRFAVIGHTTPQGDGFEVRINGAPVGPADREDMRAVEFLWEFGPKRRIDPVDCPKLAAPSFLLADQVDPKSHPDWKVRGWLGAAAEPKTLKHDEAGSMNGIVVFARGRLIQENILDKLHFSRILNSYVTGQVEADFLDRKGDDDIATSDRQRLIEDDPRYVALTDFLRNTLVSIQDQWTDLRNQARGKQAITEIPVLGEWLGTLPPSQRLPAEKLLGLIRGLELDEEKDPHQRTHLYRSGMLAFERLRLRQETSALAQIHDLTAEKLLPLLSDLSDLEGSLYREIVRTRLDVIKEFESLVDGNEKEKVLQKHLFENLWLLDAGWERAAGSERIEKSLKKDYKIFDPKLTEEQSKGRVDIRYRTNADQHIIVELKRAKRRLTMGELVDQGNKYRAALRKCLAAEGKHDAFITVVFVVGTALAEEDEPDGHEIIQKTLSGNNSRAVHYETLIRGARDAYREYLEKSETVDRTDAILTKLAEQGLLAAAAATK